MPKQTVQTLIRLLLKKQSDQGHHCILFWQAYYESITLKEQEFIWGQEVKS